MSFEADSVKSSPSKLEVGLPTSPAESNYGVVLIDHNRAARRAAVLAEALKEAVQSAPNDRMTTLKIAELYTYSLPEIQKVVESFVRSAVFIAVDEEQLTSLTSGRRIPRVPCGSISCAYQLLDRYRHKVDIYFIVRRNASALDVMSMLLSGVRGVIDWEVLGSTELMTTIVCGLQTRNDEPYVLAGRPAHLLDSFVQLVRTKYRMAKRHFALLVALAEIPEPRLEINTKVTQKEVVNQVQRHFDETGYSVKVDTYRLLPTLLTILKDELSDTDDDGWDNEESDSRFMLTKTEKHDLAILPTYARTFGLPQRVLPVRGVNQQDLIAHIYKNGLQSFDTLKVREPKGVQIRHVTLRLSSALNGQLRRNRKRRTE